jgi:hypothetical protein
VLPRRLAAPLQFVELEGLALRRYTVVLLVIALMTVA